MSGGRQWRRAIDDAIGSGIDRVWNYARRTAAIRSGSPRASKFGAFGGGSIIGWPITTLYNESYVRIGSGVWIAEGLALGVGVAPGQQMLTNPVLTIGDRCLIGRGSGIVAHFRVEIGADVWTGHHVYITDQNHGYEDLDTPIGRQAMPESPVSIGDGSWLGHGVIVLPGVTIGRHVVVAAGSVVTSSLPDNCVAGGVPAKVIRHYDPEQGWLPRRNPKPNAADWLERELAGQKLLDSDRG